MNEKEERRAQKEAMRKQVFGDPDQYIGNIWGWKFSKISLVIIVAFTMLVAYGHCSGQVDMRTGKPFQQEQPVNHDQ